MQLGKNGQHIHIYVTIEQINQA